MKRGFSGCSASRNNSWAVIRLAVWSFTSPWRHMIRSRSRREKISNDRSPSVVLSMTTGTKFEVGGLVVDVVFLLETS